MLQEEECRKLFMSFIKHGIVHGALHPFDIFNKLDGSGIIDHSDLSRNEAQKLLNGKFPVNGICFQCPQGVHKGVLTEESDMYSFGCLMLWLMFSTVKFNETLIGIPDLSTLNIDVKSSAEYSIICSLLLQQASERTTVQDLLKASYFTLTDSEESAVSENLEACSISCINSDILTSLSVGEDSTSVIEENCFTSSESGLIENVESVLRNHNDKQLDNGSKDVALRNHNDKELDNRSKDVEAEYEVAAAFNALKESIGEVLDTVESNSFSSVNKCERRERIRIHIMNYQKMPGSDLYDRDDFIEDSEGGDSEERNQGDAIKEVETKKCENSEAFDNSN
ncbi:uncharacterized protein LOC143244910 isoform X2 [Tachypleus tridentatus]|uniref:uncharacterized protein LOC143244910 isoform X2 n=1 Tax=Tachypleus tridentatus TaxID=6853 RepID=UPI003FD07D2B